mmetsp:Transcript_31108/g.77414  ORF Transcript_31108/g.77414 Transcript_31108/m.77414 type:complete len:85 (+) Transcript_31108:313-567(+)
MARGVSAAAVKGDGVGAGGGAAPPAGHPHPHRPPSHFLAHVLMSNSVSGEVLWNFWANAFPWNGHDDKNAFPWMAVFYKLLHRA